MISNEVDCVEFMQEERLENIEMDRVQVFQSRVTFNTLVGVMDFYGHLYNQRQKISLQEQRDLLFIAVKEVLGRLAGEERLKAIEKVIGQVFTEDNR